MGLSLRSAEAAEVGGLHRRQRERNSPIPALTHLPADTHDLIQLHHLPTLDSPKRRGGASRVAHASLTWRLMGGPSPAGRCFGHGTQGRPRLLIGAAGQRDQAGGGQGGLLDRHVGMLLEQAQEPPRRDARMPARILPCNQDRQLERVDETQLREIPHFAVRQQSREVDQEPPRRDDRPLTLNLRLAVASAESTRSVRWELSKRTGPEVRWRTGASSPLSLERTGAPSPSKEVQPRAADRVIAPVLAVNLPVFDLRLNASDSPVTFPRPMACRKIAYGWPCEVEAPPPSGPRRPNKLMGLLFP